MILQLQHGMLRELQHAVLNSLHEAACFLVGLQYPSDDDFDSIYLSYYRYPLVFDHITGADLYEWPA